jgi:hypothetical protein
MVHDQPSPARPHSALFQAARILAALVFAAGFFWTVARRCGPPYGRAIIHVTERDVDVTIDDELVHVRRRLSQPITRMLRPGRHVLSMKRDGSLLDEQEFVIARGQDAVLTAWRSRPAPPVFASQLTPVRVARPLND